MSTEREYEYQYQRTGHSMLNVSDFGWWSCGSCKRRGDDWTSPEDYPCVEEEKPPLDDVTRDMLKKAISRSKNGQGN